MMNDISKILTAADKKLLAHAMREYINAEMFVMIQNEAEEYAKKWVKQHKDKIYQEAEVQLQGQLSKAIKKLRIGVTTSY